MSFSLAPWWNKAVNALRVQITNRLDQAYVPETLCSGAVTAVTDTYYYYVDMAGFRKTGFQFDATMGIGSSGIIKVYGTLQSDGTAPDSCTYIDITSDTFGVASLILPANSATDDLWIDNLEKLACYKYIQIKFDYIHAAASTLNIYHKRLY